MKVASVFLLVACFCGASALKKRQDILVPPKPTGPPTKPSDPQTKPPGMTTQAGPDVTMDAMTTVAGPVMIPDENCTDKLDDCRRYGASGCVGIYESWAKANCPRYCRFCIHPNDTMKECKDNIDNCNEYQSDMCTNPSYRIFAEDNCQLYCNLCDAGPARPISSGSVTTKSPSVTSGSVITNGTCKDTVDYCWGEPDENCFGIYEPWARGHCPYRCGFCDEKPPCKDELTYCSQYDAQSCNSPAYIGWARKNCRKTCNLCDLPTRSPNQVTGQTLPGGGTPTPPSATASSAPKNQTAPTFNPGIDGAKVVGNKGTFIIEGPPPKIPGTCLYKGETHPQDKNWYDGCDYVCNCFDSSKNRIICTERCISWGNLPNELSGCSLVSEPGDCCQRLECNA